MSSLGWFKTPYGCDDAMAVVRPALQYVHWLNVSEEAQYDKLYGRCQCHGIMV
jgi:hypothetical protein